jgi:hypothetical protein
MRGLQPSLAVISRFFSTTITSSSVEGCGMARAISWLWNRFWAVSSGDHMNMSPRLTPFTWMPAGATSVSVFSRETFLAASSAAIQPPIDVPTRCTPDKVELLHEIEIEEGEVADRVEPFRRVGSAETRMLGHDHVVPLRQHVHEGQPFSGTRSAMQEQQRLALPLAHQLDAAARHRLHRLFWRHRRASSLARRRARLLARRTRIVHLNRGSVKTLAASFCREYLLLA